MKEVILKDPSSYTLLYTDDTLTARLLLIADTTIVPIDVFL